MSAKGKRESDRSVALYSLSISLSNGELVGAIRADNNARYTRIPAVIKLF